MLFNLWAQSTYFIKDFALYILILLLAFIVLPFFSFKVLTSATSARKKKILSSAIFTVFIFILTFSAFEAYFRYIYDQPDGLGFLKVNGRWHQRHVVFNSYFFRDKNFDLDKKKGITRIGVIGDSITQGDGIEDVNDRFSNLLEKKLKDAGKNVEVYNLGKSGYDTEGEIEVYESAKDFNFDIIVWQYFINDIQPKAASTGSPILEKNGERAKYLNFISEKSFFLDFLYWRFSTIYNRTIVALRTADIDQYKNEAVLEKHKKDITEFANSLKAENKHIVVVMFPSLYLLNKDSYPTFINDTMENHFRQNKLEVINLYDYLKDQDSKSLTASRFDTHPNEKVHAQTAQLLFEKIISVF